MPKDRHVKQCGCGAMIRWAIMPTTGKNHPYNLDGTSHFSTCPRAQEYRRRPISANHPEPPAAAAPKAKAPAQETLFGDISPLAQ